MAFSHPLVMVEVIPLSLIESSSSTGGTTEGGRTTCHLPPLSSRISMISTPHAKLQLISMSRQGLFSKGWLMLNDDDDDAAIHNNTTTKHRGLFLRQHNNTSSRIDNDDTFDHQSNIISGDLIFRGKDTSITVAESQSTTANMHHISSPTVALHVTYLKSDDPLDECGVPCYLRGYILAKETLLEYNNRCCNLGPMLVDEHHCMVTDDTIIQICHPNDVFHYLDPTNSGLLDTIVTRCDYDLHSALLGSFNISQPQQLVQQHDRNRSQSFTPSVKQDVEIEKKLVSTKNNRPIYSYLACYNKQTVDALSLRMSTVLSNTVYIGTTRHALSMRKKKLHELELMNKELHTFRRSMNQTHGRPIEDIGVTKKKKNSIVPLLLREGAILVHNSYHNSGKTILVQSIATDILKCNAVHVLSAPVLFAKYGTSADAALETLLHELAIRCAVVHQQRSGSTTQQQQSHPSLGQGFAAKLCIILDHFESFLPYSSRQAGGGDPYVPVLNAMAAYLNRLSFSLKNRNEFPFPSNNPLYNVCHTDQASPGFTLPIGICLVGIMTCSEGIGNSKFQCAIETLGGGRFRTPLPSATTRLSAFRHCFEVCGIELTDDAKLALPEICASVTWASGGSFVQCAKTLQSELTRGGVFRGASEQDLRKAMIQGRNQSTRTSFPSLSGRAKEVVTFSSVGGNLEAKLALEDALALSSRKQRLLSKFGLKLPTGVLLYGPPGTGKTLLAKCVAQSLKNETDHMEHDNNSGGSFISLKASDIVRPEVGNSEKLIVAAFETARQNAPSVIFIDEFQALFGDRDGGGFILGQLSSTLLQCMDDIARWSEVEPKINDDEKHATSKNGRIVVLGATNAPWMIDKAFLRLGRFDRAVHVGLPSVKDSEEILCVHVSRMKLAPLIDGASSVDEICKSMANLTLGYSGADLAALCRSAAVRCLSNGYGAVTKQNFLDACMHDVKRSSDNKLVKRISAWQP